MCVCTVGLVNLGNTCFLNSTLQAIATTDILCSIHDLLMERIKGGRHQVTLKSISPTVWAICAVLLLLGTRYKQLPFNDKYKDTHTHTQTHTQVLNAYVLLVLKQTQTHSYTKKKEKKKNHKHKQIQTQIQIHIQTHIHTHIHTHIQK
eukprot:GHVR01025086.1.p1 GENE.GHVR01025086.1~~GHVR01025086.1.p1  ORF type:complete len:148 (-),score=58.35 GHVR01025086.1:339-782(-)